MYKRIDWKVGNCEGNNENQNKIKERSVCMKLGRRWLQGSLKRLPSPILYVSKLPLQHQRMNGILAGFSSAEGHSATPSLVNEKKAPPATTAFVMP